MEESETSAQDDLSRAQWQFTHNNTWGLGNGGEMAGERRGLCFHTDTAGSHISGDHDRAAAGLELVQDPVALILLLVTVDCWMNC